MKNYYRLMLGQDSVYAEECFSGGFIGTDFLASHDLTRRLPDELRAFNKEFVPIYLAENPNKSKIAAGLGCGALWTVSKGIKRGDVVLSPDGSGTYHVAEVTGDYTYEPGKHLPHRRAVQWIANVERSAMSEALQHSAGSIGTVANVSRYHDEIEKLLGGRSAPKLISTDGEVEDPHAFALEEHLQSFLVKNWSHTDLGRDYDIYEEEGEKVGEGYLTDTGPLDILAVSKDKNKILVVELKKGRASDAVVGQILRYMSYVRDELAENQEVHGMIIALEDDQRIRRALGMAQNVQFYRYKIEFSLVKG